MLQGGGREVWANDQVLFYVDKNLTARHVWPVESRRLYTPDLWLVPDERAHYLLSVAHRHCAHQ